MNFSLLLLIALVLSACGANAPVTVAPVAATDVAATPVTMGFTPASVCLVPNIVGLDQSRAEEILVKIGLQPVKKYQEDPSVAKDALISQEPGADTRLSPCTGDVTMVVSLGGPSIPTETPAPPTLTPTATPIPPTATPTPDPRLFWDDFDTGIKPEWGMTGDNFTVLNGSLRSEGILQGAMGNASWNNYAVEFVISEMSGQDVKLRFRVQDRNNYMEMQFNSSWEGYFGSINKVVDGKKTQIPGSDLRWHGGGDWGIRIEMVGDYYLIKVNRDKVELSFVDNTFTNGGVWLEVNGPFEMKEIVVEPIP